MYPAFLLHHAEAHKKPVKEDPSNPQRDLRQVEHHASLVDKIDTLCSPESLLRGRYPINDAGCALNLI
jgi:hypothetical protein